MRVNLQQITLPMGRYNLAPPEPTIRCEYRNEADVVELAFHDVIGAWWDDSTSKNVAGLLRENRGKPVNISINSGGGYVFEAIGIFNLLAEHDGIVTTTIDGQAASAATLIAEAGDVRRMRDTSSLMIHRAWGAVVGNAGELRAEAAVLDKVDQQIARVYAARAGGSVGDWIGAMAGKKDSDGTWYTPEEAKAAGLVDEVIATSASSKAKNSADKPDDGLEVARQRLKQQILIRQRVLKVDSE